MSATALGWAVAAYAICWSVRRGRTLQRIAPEIYLGAAPLVGRNYRDGWDWRFGWCALGAAAIGVSLATSCWRGWWARLRLRWVAAITAAGSMLFALLLALVDGADGVLHGAEDRTEYLVNLRITPPAGEFVSTFVDRLHDYSVHVRGHPPGFVLVLKVLDRIGIGGGWTTALLSVAAAGVLPVAVLVVVQRLAGADWTRRTAPFLVVSPYAIWMVTSADAVYTAAGAAGIAAITVGLCQQRWRAAASGLAGGVLLGALLFGTYLAAVLLIVPVAIVGHGFVRRAPGALVTCAGAVVGGLAVIGGFAVAGFWWLDGTRQTKAEYWAGTAQFRTWGYFGVANLATALIALGPATLAGLLRLRDRRLWIVVGAALAALLTSHLSQYTKAEVERIWLLFYPWIAVAGASVFVPRAAAQDNDPAIALTVRRHVAAIWIALQGAGAIVLQSALVSKW